MGVCMNVAKPLASLVLVLIACCAVASAQTAPDSSSVFVPTITSAPAIDGDLTTPAWQAAAKISLVRNLKDRSLANQATTAYLMVDKAYLYVGFDAKQSGPVQASQHTNDTGGGTDDNVTVYLYPNGTSGFSYAFTSNPIGTHYQSSSENTSYAPTWLSSGRIVPGGYTVTMRIPLAALRGGGANWRIALERFEITTLNDYVWPYTAQQTNAGTSVFAAALTGMPGATAATRPQPRIGLYGLGLIAPSSYGGSTSRIGLDASLPITATTSLVATVHPDYSNVEQDQQSISPTAFARNYSEVRPFFTQLNNYFGNFSCIGCPGVTELYTPAIPTPRYGYAIEGHESTFSFAGFDAVGNQRSDTAQNVNYRTPDSKNGFSMQRTSIDGTDVCPYTPNVSSLSCLGVPSVHEETSLFGVTHDSLKGLYEFANYGTESGTFVSNASAAHRQDAGIGFYNKDTSVGFTLQKFGAQYLSVPLSSYTSQTDLAGYSAVASTTIYRKPNDFISRVLFYGDLDSYHDATGEMDRFDTQAAIGLDLPHKIHFRIQTGSDYTRLADGNFVPTNENGVNLTYNYNTDVPINLSYGTGRFGAGTIASWANSATTRFGRALVTLEVDQNTQWLDGGYGRLTSWLDRASVALQQGKNASLAFGVRRIMGQSPILEETFDHGVFVQPESASAYNVSGAYYRRFPQDEVYFVYGDASAYTTAPQFIVKWIHYFGASKGT